MGNGPQAGADEPGPEATIQPRVRLSTVLREGAASPSIHS